MTDLEIHSSQAANPGAKPNPLHRWLQTKGAADLSLLMVALIWGSTYVATKDVVSHVPVFSFLFVRFFLTTLFMSCLTYRAIRRASRATWTNGLLFGGLLFLIFALETLGIARTSAANAGFLISLCIVFVPVLDAITRHRWPSWRVATAVTLCVVGTGLLTLHRGGYHFNPGDGLILGAALVRAIQMKVTDHRTRSTGQDASALTTIQLGVVMLGTGIMALAGHESMTGFRVQDVMWTMYLVVFATMFCFYAQLVMIRRTSAASVAFLLSSEPVFAALFAVSMLGERISGAGALGGALIVIGMIWGRRLHPAGKT